MRSQFLLGTAFALTLLCGTQAFADGYPGHGKAIDKLETSSDYGDLAPGRPRALGIMRARAQGFVPSPELHDYVRGVLMRDLAGLKMPPSFNPDVHILAAPEFTALCTPDGTIIVTIGLLEQLENEDELAFVLGHEVSHYIYRHHDSDWFKQAQYYMVINGAAVDSVAQSTPFAFGAANNNNLARGLDLASHVAKLSSNVLAPQMERSQEDAADALGFDLMVKAGYDPEAPLALMDILAIQEAEAAQAAQQAKAAESADNGGSGGSSGGAGGFLGSLSSGLGGITGIANIAGGGRPDSNTWTNLGIVVFDSAVDSMSTQATSHHPAKVREELLSSYFYREYRDVMATAPTPLPWSADSTSPLKAKLTMLLAHYAAAEDAAGFVADPTSTTPVLAQSAVMRSTTPPTTDHAYTEYVAAEYYDGKKQAPQSEAALTKAIAGPEPSWEVYSRLLDIYIARNDLPRAQGLMAQAVQRFDNSPVLLPKRIQIAHLMGNESDVSQLLPQCDAFDIKELYAECKKMAGKG
jgi:Zn-dependent protease with chaperone function